ncbi:MAG: hypothetical protein KDI10_00400 [Halioglobus sp.]|nr:hypothetical protein [Halioglobus sp.]
MTTARFIEYRITRDLVHRRHASPVVDHDQLAERLITISAVTAGMLLLGSYAQELLWALLAGAAVLTLGTRTG